MSAEFEKAVERAQDNDPRPRLLFELVGEIEAVRERADALGMFTHDVYFIVPTPERELRICGRPTTLRLHKTGESNDYLYLLVNDIQRDEKKGWFVYSEEIVISEKGIAHTPTFGYRTIDDPLTSSEQFPVIWDTKANTWEVFRGKQDYYAPHDPHIHFRHLDLEVEVTMANHLSGLLSGLTVGNEDAKYPRR